MLWPSERLTLFFLNVTVRFSFRLARKERDLRAAEGRLKQYEIEISELKAQNDALGFDANRKTDENVVSAARRRRFLDLDRDLLVEKEGFNRFFLLEESTWCEWWSG